MTKFTKTLTEASAIEIRDLISITLALFYNNCAEDLFIDEFVPNLGFHPIIPFSKLNYGSLAGPIKLDFESLLEDFRNILQLESIRIYSLDDKFHLHVEDGAIYRVKTENLVLSELIGVIVGE